MTDQINGPASRPITAEGLGAIIPAALLVALIGRQSALPTEPVTVDASALRIVVPPDTIADILRTLMPDREISVTSSEGALTVAVPGLLMIQLDIPADGLRVHVDEGGVRLGGG